MKLLYSLRGQVALRLHRASLIFVLTTPMTETPNTSTPDPLTPVLVKILEDEDCGHALDALGYLAEHSELFPSEVYILFVLTASQPQARTILTSLLTFP